MINIGTSVVKLLNLFVVTCNLSKNCCSLTRMKASGLPCVVCVLQAMTESADKEREIAPCLR